MTEPLDAQTLTFSALDHAIDSVSRSGGPLTPFVMRAEGDTIHLARFVADTLEESQEHARAHARAADPATTLIALAYDGYLTLDDTRRDAIFVQIQSAGTATSELYAQQYEIVRGQLTEVGNVKHVASQEPPLLSPS